MPAARRHDDQPRCDQCNNYGDWCEAADEYRCDSCWLSEEAAEAERHDAFLHKLVDDEYWFKVRAAKIDLERPTVGLLNIGVEEVKGVEAVRGAAELLRAMNLPQLDFIGFVEGDGIGKGAADVIVTEGFSGNIALKTAEGTARQIAEYLRSAMSRTWRSKLGYIFARGAFNALRDKMDPRKVNGGVFLGLNGVVIKSHGGTDAEGFASAVDVGYDMVRYDLLPKINQTLNRDGHALSIVPNAQEAVS